ncbi:MAG: hypothetical protein K0Q51_673 [Rickettsiaceae bacterium]|jgi:hypothetical protein|nr:hypothetical protein [Rickettsiaceae bacterium]
MFKTLSKTSLLKSTFSLAKSSFRAPKSVPVNNYSTNIEVSNLKTNSSNFDKDQFEKLLKR